MQITSQHDRGQRLESDKPLKSMKVINKKGVLQRIKQALNIDYPRS